MLSCRTFEIKLLFILYWKQILYIAWILSKFVGLTLWINITKIHLKLRKKRNMVTGILLGLNQEECINSPTKNYFLHFYHRQICTTYNLLISQYYIRSFETRNQFDIIDFFFLSLLVIELEVSFLMDGVRLIAACQIFQELFFYRLHAFLNSKNW